MIIYNDLLINMVNMVIFLLLLYVQFPEGMSEFLTAYLAQRDSGIESILGKGTLPSRAKTAAIVSVVHWSQYSDTWCGWMSLIDFCSVKKGFV